MLITVSIIDLSIVIIVVVNSWSHNSSIAAISGLVLILTMSSNCVLSCFAL